LSTNNAMFIQTMQWAKVRNFYEVNENIMVMYEGHRTQVVWGSSRAYCDFNKKEFYTSRRW